MTIITTTPGPFYPNQPQIVINPNTTIIQPTTILQPSIHQNPIVKPPALHDAFKPKKAGSATCHVVVILDNSGSMQSCRAATIEGFNGFLQAQIKDAKETNITTYLSLYKFSGYSLTKVIDHKNVFEVEELNMNTYNPNGGTNLNDAIGGVLMEINNQLGVKKKADRDSIIVCILTDGEENTSRTFSTENAKQMVSKAEKAKWSFMFLGANIDAFAVGSTYGFSASNSMQFSTQNVRETMAGATRMTSSLKSAYASNSVSDVTAVYAAMGFTDQERDDSVK